MKKQRMIQFIFLFVIIIISLFPNFSLASGATGGGDDVGASMDPIENPDFYNPSSSTSDFEVDKIEEKANMIINVIKNIGIVISVLTLVIIGIKFMLGSVEEKAEYKKTMIPYLVGAFMLFAIPQLLQILYNIVKDLN